MLGCIDWGRRQLHHADPSPYNLIWYITLCRSQMVEDTQLYNSEDRRLRGELNNLSRMLNALEGDLKEL